MVVQEQYVLRVSLTGGDSEKEDIFIVPEQCKNGCSGTMCFEGLINRACIRKR